MMLLLFGCLGGNGGEVKNETVEENKTVKPPPIKIITGIQQNQTVTGEEMNITKEENETEEKRKVIFEDTPEMPLGIYFINVSTDGPHGNAVLIKKGNFDMLVDAGPAEYGNQVVDFLRSREVDDIEVLVSTNADPRNYGGINAVADKYIIESVWWNGDDFYDQDYKAIIERISTDIEEVNVVEAGFAKEFNGIKFEVLNPIKTRFENINNDAVVLRVEDRTLSILLTSGIQTGAQGELINRQKEKIKTDVIQAPYYGVGSGTSQIGVFLINAEPQEMIITGSSDESPENGGSREPFKRLMDQYGIEYYENYKTGPIRIMSTEQGYSIDELGKG